jgi:hypothetical protein
MVTNQSVLLQWYYKSDLRRKGETDEAWEPYSASESKKIDTAFKVWPWLLQKIEVSFLLFVFGSFFPSVAKRLSS